MCVTAKISITFSSCADDTQIVYVDGKQVNSGPKEIMWNQVIITPIPNNTRVVAIQVTNLWQGQGGWRGAFSDKSVFTDGSWKCSATFTVGWQNVDFDDSLWPAAATTGDLSNGVCDDLLPSAKWLWTDEFYNEAITIYCRKTLSKFTIN